MTLLGVDLESGLTFGNLIIEKNVVLEINEENPNESSLTIVTRSVDNGLVTENTEKCYGSRAELLLMAAKISGNQHENEISEIQKNK